MKNSILNNLFYVVLGTLSFIIWSLTTFGGGTKVNNGYGVVEMEVINSFQLLPKLIKACADIDGACLPQLKPKGLLGKINAVTSEISNNENRIEFISGNFTSGSLQPKQAFVTHGTVSTGNSETTDIFYWNKELFYNSYGTPILDLEKVLSVWTNLIVSKIPEIDTHEISQIEAGLQGLLRNNTYEERINIRDIPLPLKLRVINYPGISAQGDLFVSNVFRGVSLNRQIADGARCTQKQMLLGWNLFEFHWGQVIETQGIRSVEIKGTVIYRCLEASQIKENLSEFKHTIEI